MRTSNEGTAGAERRAVPRAVAAGATVMRNAIEPIASSPSMSNDSTGMPHPRIRASNAWAGPSRSRSIASSAPRSARIDPTRTARSTSGSAENAVSDGRAITNPSTRSIPIARSAGTTTRDPVSGAPPDPAPTTSTVPGARTTRHPPCATCRRVASTASGGNGSRSPGSRAIHATTVTAIAAQAIRAARRGATHAAAIAASAAAQAHPAGSWTGCVDHGLAAAAAVSPSAAAPAAATAPHAPPSAGARSPSAIVPTPATVVTAATGMVITLSGTASVATEPPCAAAMGVLTDHATVAATTHATHASATIPATSCPSHPDRSGRDASSPRIRPCQRRVAPGARRRSAATTP